MAPPSASISLTRWPLPIPPIDGLQDIWPSVSMLCVSNSVLQPMRAEASAASVPACPPPITMTSNVRGNSMEGAILRRRFHVEPALVFHVEQPVPCCGAAFMRGVRQSRPRDFPCSLCRAAPAARTEAGHCRLDDRTAADRHYRAGD